MDGETYTQLDTAKCDVCGKDKKDTHWLNGKRWTTAICNECDLTKTIDPYFPNGKEEICQWCGYVLGKECDGEKCRK